MSGALFVVLLAVVAALQWAAGAYTGAFVSDVPGHYITGLAVHDWLRHHFLGNPVPFVIDYHAHLPMTAFGLWPPLFHGVEGVWMLVFGTGRASILVLSAAVTAALGTAVGIAVARRAGWIAGGLAGLLMVANPLVQRASAELMLDVPCALAGFLAALAYAAFLERSRWGRAALAFGLLATAALLIRYNAVALAVVPPLCVLIGRRWDLLVKPGFYAPAAVVAVLAGPWYLLTRGLAEQGFQFSWGMTYLRLASSYNAHSIVEALTPLVAVLAVLGLVRVLWRGGQRGAQAVAPVEIACAALALAVFLTLLAIPVALQDRYMIPAVPPLVVLAALEAARLFAYLRTPALRYAGGAVLVASAIAASLPVPQVKQDRLAEVVRAVQAALPRDNPVVLLVADGTNEGALTAEIAMSETQRPRIWVIRGSRLLGGGGYNTADYVPRFSSPEPIMGEIERYGVPIVILQHSDRPRGWVHIGQFATLVEQSPDRFERLAVFGDTAPVEVLRVRGQEGRRPDAAALTELSGPRALMRLLK